MKKILFIIALFCGFVANSQKTTGSNYTYINQRYEWLTGIFQALGLPAGSGPAAFKSGQEMRAGAIYYDTLGTDAGFYIYTGTAWVLQGTPSAVSLPNELLAGGSVTPQGTGFNMSVQEAVYRISGIIYGSDSGTVTLSGSDPSLNRIDYIYLGTDGAFHVLEGTPGLPAAEPRLENDQLGIAFVSIPAGSTTPGISTVVVYNENTESTVSNAGTTTDPDNTTNVFTGAKSLSVTNIAANDMIHFTAPITFNASGFDALAIHMLPKAVLGSGNRLYVQLFVGSTAVSNEVEIVWNRNNITTYQAISISAQALGTLTNYNVTRVRLRYVGSGANFAGFYFDYIFFQTGTSQPNPPGGGGFPNIIPPPTWGVSGNGTQNITITAPGLRDKVLRGGGTAETDSSVKAIGTINSQTPSANGAVINTATRELVLQYATAVVNGILSAFDWGRFDTTARQTVENLDPTVDTLLTSITPFRSGIMGIKDSTGIGIHNNGRYLAFYNTGATTPTLQQVFNTQIGGSVMTKNDTILAPARTLLIDGTTTFGTLNVKTTTGWGVYSQATGTGTPFVGTSVSGPAFNAFMVNTTTTGTEFPIIVQRTTSGTAANGIGNGIKFNTELDNGSVNEHFTLEGEWTDNTGSARTSKIKIRSVKNGGALTDWFVLDSSYAYLHADTLATRAYARSVGGGGGGSGTVTNVATGYGLSGGPITTTGTIQADSLVMANRVWVTDRIAEIETPNLIVDSLGVNGVELVIPRNDSLLHRLFTDGVFTKADTLSTGEAVSNLDTANSLLKLYIQANSTGSAGVLWSRLSSDHTLTDVNTDQVLFPSSQDIFPVQANTLYLVEGVYEFTTGTASHSKGIGFTLAGGATVASSGIESQSWGTVPGTSSTASTNIFLTGLTTVTATALTTAGGATMTFKGLIQVTDAGTFQPIVRFTSAPGGTNLLKANSWLKMTPIGADTFTTAGGVN